MFDHDPAEEFEELRGLTRRALRPTGRSERWLRRPSYDQVTLGMIRNATLFSADPVLWNPLALIGEFMQHSFAEALAELAGVFSRRCPKGNWPVTFLAYVMSGRRSMERFYNELGPQVFVVCGFDEWTPSYPEMYNRFVELESRWDAYVDTLALIVAPALKAVPSLGLVGMLDSSHATSPAAIHHERDALHWPHRDGLKWPHPPSGFLSLHLYPIVRQRAVNALGLRGACGRVRA